MSDKTFQALKYFDKDRQKGREMLPSTRRIDDLKTTLRDAFEAFRVVRHDCILISCKVRQSDGEVVFDFNPMQSWSAEGASLEEVFDKAYPTLEEYKKMKEAELGKAKEKVQELEKEVNAL